MKVLLIALLALLIIDASSANNFTSNSTNQDNTRDSDDMNLGDSKTNDTSYKSPSNYEAGPVTRSYECQGSANKQENLGFILKVDQKECQAASDYDVKAKIYIVSDNNDNIVEVLALAVPLLEQEAIRHQNDRNCSLSALYYNAAGHAYRELGNTNKSSQMLEKSGSEYEQAAIYNQDYYGYSVPYFKKSSDAYREAGNTNKSNQMLEKVALSYDQAARKYFNSSNYIPAIRRYRDASNIYREINISKCIQMLEKEALVCQKMAMQYQADKNYNSSIEYYRNAAEIYREINAPKCDEMLEKEALIYREIAMQYQSNRDYCSAGLHYRNAANIYKQLNKKSDAIDMYTLALEFYTTGGDKETAQKMRAESDELQKNLQ